MLEALERSVSAQRRLVTDASHELRTPLTSLRTNIEVLTRDASLAPADRSRLLADVTAQMEELSKLADDLLALARAEEEAAPKAEVRLDEVVERAVDTARRGAEDRVIELSLEETWVLGDASALERAVVNLLDNAVKWSPASGRIDVALADGELTVTDDGPGVPPDDLPRIFDRFFRSTASRSTEGSGLGLAIVQRVAESHGGRAWADNADGRGARLRLRIPVAAPPGG
jgi:two-component system sensor histidine kinase MprB